MTLKKKFLVFAGAVACIIAVMFVAGKYAEAKRAEQFIALCEKLDGASPTEVKFAIMEWSPYSNPQTQELAPKIEESWAMGPFRFTAYSRDNVVTPMSGETVLDVIIVHHAVYRLNASWRGKERPLWTWVDHLHLSTVSSYNEGRCEVSTRPLV